MARVIYRIDAVDGAKIDNLTSARCDLPPDAILGGTQRAAATLHRLLELLIGRPLCGLASLALALTYTFGLAVLEHLPVRRGLPAMASARSRRHRRSHRRVVRSAPLWTGASKWAAHLPQTSVPRGCQSRISRFHCQIPNSWSNTFVSSSGRSNITSCPHDRVRVFQPLAFAFL